MRYDQYYLVHRLIENLSEEGEGEEEGILEVMVTSVLRNGCDKKWMLKIYTEFARLGICIFNIKDRAGFSVEKVLLCAL